MQTSSPSCGRTNDVGTCKPSDANFIVTTPQPRLADGNALAVERSAVEEMAAVRRPLPKPKPWAPPGEAEKGKVAAVRELLYNVRILHGVNNGRKKLTTF